MFKTANNKLGFIHIPKTGGTSVEIGFRRLRDDAKWAPYEFGQTHSTYKAYKKYYSREATEPEQWFTLVRNPFARYHSWYYYQMEWDRRRLAGEMNLKGLPREHFQKRLDLMQRIGLKGCLYPEEHGEFAQEVFQKWIKTTQWQHVRRCPTMNVFKLEEIDKMYDWLNNEIGCPIKPAHEKKNPAKKGTWQDEFDDEIRRRVIEVFADDFEHFDYPTE